MYSIDQEITTSSAPTDNPEFDQITAFIRAVHGDDRMCIAISSGSGFSNHYCDNASAAVDLATRANALQKDVYFTPANIGPLDSRKATNIESARSHWGDLDTLKSHPDAKYAGKREAIMQLKASCAQVGLTMPSIVGSGYGVHVYWSHDEEIPPSLWLQSAHLLQVVMDDTGLYFDRACTADITRLLRLPGTHNHKRGDRRPVQLLYTGRTIPHGEFLAKLQAYARTHDIGPKGARRSVGANSDLSAGLATSSWFDKLSPADKDACLAEMLAVPGIVALADTSDGSPKPNWLTVLAACARSGAPGAYDICRRWAATSRRFDDRDFETRFWSFAGG